MCKYLLILNVSIQKRSYLIRKNFKRPAGDVTRFKLNVKCDAKP